MALWVVFYCFLIFFKTLGDLFIDGLINPRPRISASKILLVLPVASIHGADPSHTSPDRLSFYN